MVGHRLGLVGAVVRQALLWTACLSGALLSGGAQADKVVEPHFVLTEQHHHVVPHLVNFARQGVLRSHRNAPLTDFKNIDGAVLVHLDSHADGNLPAHMAATMRENLPAEGPETHDLLRHTCVNDFLLLLGYMGIVEHIIFVEPPWSPLMEEVHSITVDISIGVSLEDDEEDPNREDDSLTNEEGYPLMYASIHSPLLDDPAPRKEALEEAIGRFSSMMDTEVVLDHEDLMKRCGKIRTIRFTVLPYEGAAHTLINLLDKEGMEKDIILDVDLDGFGTTSPGAMAMHDAIPSYEDLMRVYHTAHNLCDMDPNYWEQLLENNSKPECTQELSLVHGPPFQAEMPDGFRISGKTKRRINSLSHRFMPGDVYESVEEVLEFYSSSITDNLRGKFAEKMDAFLTQPFHIEERTIEPIIDYWHEVFKTVFVGNRVPAVIHVVRSPFYTPHHHLDSIECKALDALLDVFGPGAGVFHAKEVELNRTGCGNKFPPKLQHDIGEHVHLDPTPWARNVHDAFYWGYDDEDGPGDGDGNAKNPILMKFVNQHEVDIVLSSEGERLNIAPGSKKVTRARHLSKWDLHLASEPKSPIHSLTIDEEEGRKQSFGSMDGTIPVKDEAPVYMDITNPDDSETYVEVRFVDEDEETESFVAVLAPGDTHGTMTFHGHRFALYALSDDDHEHIMGEVTVDATNGDVQEVVMFEDEL